MHLRPGEVVEVGVVPFRISEFIEKKECWDYSLLDVGYRRTSHPVFGSLMVRFFRKRLVMLSSCRQTAKSQRLLFFWSLMSDMGLIVRKLLTRHFVHWKSLGRVSCHNQWCKFESGSVSPRTNGGGNLVQGYEVRDKWTGNDEMMMISFIGWSLHGLNRELQRMLLCARCPRSEYSSVGLCSRLLSRPDPQRRGVSSTPRRAHYLLFREEDPIHHEHDRIAETEIHAHLGRFSLTGQNNESFTSNHN